MTLALLGLSATSFLASVSAAPPTPVEAIAVHNPHETSTLRQDRAPDQRQKRTFSSRSSDDSSMVKDDRMNSEPGGVKGVRRVANTLPLVPWDLPLMRRYEILLADGSRRIATFHQVDSLLDGRRAPADFWATMDEVQRAFVGRDASFVRYPTGERIPAEQ